MILSHRKEKRRSISELALDQFGVNSEQSLELIQFTSLTESKHLPYLVASSR